jgi:hypothetical protein
MTETTFRQHMEAREAMNYAHQKACSNCRWIEFDRLPRSNPHCILGGFAVVVSSVCAKYERKLVNPQVKKENL